MRVKALETGYYNHRRQKPGSVFDLIPVHTKDKKGKPIVMSAESQFSKKWMKKLDAKEETKKIEKPETKAEKKAREKAEKEAAEKAEKAGASTGDEDVL